jgi:hypothetical protein
MPNLYAVKVLEICGIFSFSIVSSVVLLNDLDFSLLKLLASKPEMVLVINLEA